MAYKTILAALDNRKTARQVTDFAMALAETFESHVIGVHSELVAAMPLVAPMEIPDPVAVQAMQDLAADETRAIAAEFDAVAQREGVSREWRSFMATSGFGSGFIDSARAADLILLSQRDRNALSDSRGELEGALFDSGRPVLLVPTILQQPKSIERVLIAWNGSREVARATFDALPFLKRATRVEVLTLQDAEEGGENDRLPGGEIASSLARHGVPVDVVNQQKGEGGTAAGIENRLSDANIDLLVMGAYSHSRWWELLFGGTTRTVLESMTALTLLSR